MKNILIIFILTIVYFTGCGEKKSGSDKVTDKYSGTGPLKFENKEMVKSVNNCKPGETNCTYIRITYVEASDGKVKDKVNSLIKDGLLTAYEMPDKNLENPQLMMESFIKDYESFAKEFKGPRQVWTIDFDVRVHAETNKLLCLAFENSGYLGGAHPNIFVTFKNINKETGDTVSLADIFGQGFEGKLNQLIDKKFREMNNLKPGDNLQEKSDLFDNFIKYNYNFAITNDKGVEFYYNAYEIAPYAAGPIVVKLSPEDVVGIMTGASPLK